MTTKNCGSTPSSSEAFPQTSPRSPRSRLARRASAWSTIPAAIVLLGPGQALASAQADTPARENSGGVVEEPLELEEVIVTARRIEEAAPTVPLTISVIDREAIVRLGINDIEDVARYTPGLTFDIGGFPNDTRPAVRGMQSERGRPSVAVMLDGLDLSGENLAIAGGTAGVVTDLLDLERVEIVKGPQTTLYGRNAFAGAINYISRKPTDELEGQFTLEGAEYGQLRAVGAISGPLVDGLVSYRFNLAYREGDGFFTNPVNGGPLGAEEFTGIAGALRFTPGDDWDVTVRYQTSTTDNSDYPTAFVAANTRVPVPGGVFVPGPPGTPPVPCPPDLGGLPPPVVTACTRGTVVGPITADIGDVQMGVNEETGQPPRGLELDQDLLTLDARWESDFGTWRYNFGWIENDSFIEADGDFTDFPAPPGFVLSLSALQQLDYADERFDHNLFWTHGFGAFDVLVGAQWLEEESSLVNSSKFWLRNPDSPLSGPPFFLASAQSTNAFPVRITRDTEYSALYGAVKWRITDTVRLGLEARFNSDEIRYDIPGWTLQDTSLRGLAPVCLPGIPQGAIFMGVPGPDVPPPGTVQGCPRSETLSYDEWTPRVTLDWDWRENVLLYANAARGFKPGGFNTNEVIELAGQGYLPEFVDAYELGFKSRWLGNRLRLDGAIFYNDYTDQQIGVQRNQAGTGGTVVAVPGIVNAASVESRGFELAGDWFFDSGITLSFAYAYTDASFEEYVQGPAPTAPPDAFAACGVPEGQTSSAQTRAEAGNACADFSGNAVAKNPEHAANVGVLYRGLVGDRGTSWFTELIGTYRSKRYVDEANLSWMPSYTLFDLQVGLEFERFSVIGFVTNLTDDDTIRTAQRNVDPGNPEGFAPGRSVIAYLPEPRVAGVRLVFNIGL
ncbi:MAG: TonB-dependent receptor [Xanthomonadales bacterium]|nr:TonB-dependent receptor [Xanthomonadales bacterium]